MQRNQPVSDKKNGFQPAVDVVYTATQCERDREEGLASIVAKQRQYLFNKGRDWFLLKPSVRAVFLALRAIRG